MRHACNYIEITRDGISVTEAQQAIPPIEKEAMLKYMKSIPPSRYAYTLETDVIDGHTNMGPPAVIDDGSYYWSSATIYYFEHYNIPLNPDFIAHVLAQIAA